jgi:hypothetical protein
MNRAFVVGADGTNPMDTTALRLGLNVWLTFVHAEDDCATRTPLGEILAADAVTVGGGCVEQAHDVHPVWIYSTIRQMREICFYRIAHLPSNSTKQKGFLHGSLICRVAERRGFEPRIGY